jgi:hypothetical protein
VIFLFVHLFSTFTESSDAHIMNEHNKETPCCYYPAARSFAVQIVLMPEHARHGSDAREMRAVYTYEDKNLLISQGEVT